MTKHCVLAGFTLAAAVAPGRPCSATDHPAGPSQGTEMFAGVPQIAASESLDEVARAHPAPDRVAQARAASEKNPLLLADVAYYQLELANARRAQAVAAQK